jgi:hypothetical protein
MRHSPGRGIVAQKMRGQMHAGSIERLKGQPMEDEPDEDVQYFHRKPMAVPLQDVAVGRGLFRLRSYNRDRPSSMLFTLKTNQLDQVRLVSSSM